MSASQDFVEALPSCPKQEAQKHLKRLLRAEPGQALELLEQLVEQLRLKQEALEECKAALEKLHALIDEIAETPRAIGAVVRAANECSEYVVAIGNRRQEVKLHPNFAGEPLQVADVVAITTDENLIIDRVADFSPNGRVADFHSWHEGKMLLEGVANQTVTVDPCPALAEASLRQGDRILYQPDWELALSVVEHKAVATSSNHFQRVHWSQIGGLDEQIEQLKLIIATILNPELALELDMEPMRGGLFEGPPGTGKTLLARALATWFETEMGRRVIFRHVAPGAWRSSFYGSSEQLVVEPFREIESAIESGDAQVGVLFYDELDTFGCRSHDIGNHIDSRVMTRFLDALDGFRERGNTIVLAATNRADVIDEALLRPGRFGDMIIQVPRPNQEAARAILRCYLRPSTRFFSNGSGKVEPQEMVERCIDSAVSVVYANGQPDNALAELTLQDGQRRHVWPKDVANGAMLKNIVRRAKEVAFQRGQVGPRGLDPADLEYAAEVELDNIASRLRHPLKAREILGDHQLPIARVETLRSNGG